MSIQCIIFSNDVSEIDANAERHSLVVGNCLISIGYLVLYFDCAANCLNDARELGDDAIPGRTEYMTAVYDDRLFHDSNIRAQGRRRGFVIDLDKVSVPG